MIVCNITCTDNLHESKAMAKSVKSHMPDARVAVCLVEKNSHPASENVPWFDDVILAKDLGIPRFEHFMFKYEIMEGVTAVKPSFIKHLLDKYPEERHFVFLDSDIWVFQPFTDLIEAMEEQPIILTPHHIEPGAYWDTHTVTGVYNTGIVALRRSEEASRFLDWWADRLYESCSYGNGLFVDQKWVELAPAYYDTGVFRHPGYNVAYWNLTESGRSISRDWKDNYVVEGKPLCCFHFSGLESALLHFMDVNYPDKQSPIYDLYRSYEEELDRMGRQQLAHVPWSYDYFDSGEKISREARHRYRREPNFQIVDNPFAYSNRYFHIRLKIVHIAPNNEKLPPERDGGTERIVHELTEELVRRGHEVILFAPSGSTSSGTVIHYPMNFANEKAMESFIVEGLPADVHLIHDHSFTSVIGKRSLPIPTVCSIHLDINNHVQYPVYLCKRALAVTGSGYGHYIYNGLNPEQYQFSEQKQDYLLYIGRLVREKGILHALEVAEKTGKRLIVAGPIHDQYLFQHEIAPRMERNPNVFYTGPVGGQQRQDLFKNAKCVLFPSVWEEPFGLVMIEAMACGTPVLALANGSVPEVLQGFPQLICKSVEEMANKVIRFPEGIAPAELRKYVVERFTTSRMVDEYLEYYDFVRAQYPPPESILADHPSEPMHREARPHETTNTVHNVPPPLTVDQPHPVAQNTVPQHTAPQDPVPQDPVPQLTAPQDPVPQDPVPQLTVPQHMVPQHHSADTEKNVSPVHQKTTSTASSQNKSKPQHPFTTRGRFVNKKRRASRKRKGIPKRMAKASRINKRRRLLTTGKIRRLKQRKRGKRGRLIRRLKRMRRLKSIRLRRLKRTTPIRLRRLKRTTPIRLRRLIRTTPIRLRRSKRLIRKA